MEINNSVFKNGTFQAVHSSSICFRSRIQKCLISNTNFSSIDFAKALIEVSNTLLQLEGPVIFTENSGYGVICVTGSNGYVVLHNYIEFSKPRSNFIFTSEIYNSKNHIILHENTLVNISNKYDNDNMVPMSLYDDEALTYHVFYPPCYFQFTSERGNLDSEFANGKELNYSIVFEHFHDYGFLLLVMIHCYWIPGSSFYTAKPYDVYKKFIEPSVTLQQDRLICYCVNDSYKDCTTHVLGTVYPGQTIVPKLALSDLIKYMYYVPVTVTIETDQEVLPKTACKLVKIDDLGQQLTDHCAPVQYTIFNSEFSNRSLWCELF